jgi:polygalacturonase
LHFQGCQNVNIDHVSIYGDWRFPNNDGIDPDSCIDVTITNCDINVADDGICPKSTEGFGPLRNLVARNVTIRSKSHAIKFGTNTDNEISDLLFENITIWDSNAGMSIQQRSGGDIHNVTFRDINVETRYVAPRWWGNGEWLSITAEKRYAEDEIGRTYDITLENINAVTENGGMVSGKLHGVQGLVMRNVNVEIAQWSNYSTAEGPSCQHMSYEDHPEGSNDIDCMGTQDHRPSVSEVKIFFIYIFSYICYLSAVLLQ